MNSLQERMRQLPSVDQLVSEYTAHHQPALPRPILVDFAREVLQSLRSAALHSEAAQPTADEALVDMHQAVAKYQRHLFVRTINATGVILHTNLGRAPLAREAAMAAATFAQGFTNLEYRLADGVRGSRYVHCEDLLCRLTGAEAALVVNNNAAAMLLVLSALARGGEVIVSRGELIEIGGGFRIPELLEQSGCILREVGTTNRTRLTDYQQALSPETRAILKVHTSNYRIVGFAESVGSKALARLGSDHGLPVIEDLGSGVLLDTRSVGLSAEPTVGDAVRSGMDIVAFSGDKLLGGPQAGILVGRADLIDQCRRHPLARALRVDKMTLAALQSTLAIYVHGNAEKTLPIWRMISTPLAAIEARAGEMQAALQAQGSNLSVTVRLGTSTVGGGALPGDTLPTALLALTHLNKGTGDLARSLRLGEPPVIARIEDDVVLLDLRTVLPEDDAALLGALSSV